MSFIKDEDGMRQEQRIYDCATDVRDIIRRQCGVAVPVLEIARLIEAYNRPRKNDIAVVYPGAKEGEL